MTLLGKIASPLVGLTAEALASRKDKTPAEPSRLPGSSSNLAAPDGSSNQPLRSRSHSPSPAFATEDSSDDDADAAAWALDDASTAVAPAPPRSSSSINPPSIPSLLTALHTTYPLPSPPLIPAPSLPLPVILPQRRPHAPTSGFVHAYAPSLSAFSLAPGAFLAFLTALDESLRVSPWLQVVNVAAEGVGALSFVFPSPAVVAASVLMQVGERVAAAGVRRGRRNGLLEGVNEVGGGWLGGRGLCAVVVRWKTGVEGEVGVEELDVSSAAAGAAEGNGSGWRVKAKKSLRSSDAVSRGEAQLPAAAPLVWPELDSAATADNAQLSWWKRQSRFVSDYADRRAQAKFALENEGSGLAMEPAFKSEWGDPRAFKEWDEGRGLGGRGKLRREGGGEEGRGGIGGGGRGGKVAERMEERRERMGAASKGVLGRGPLGMVTGAVNLARGKEAKESMDGRKLRGEVRKGGVVGYARKKMRPDVLYLMIVQRPSEEEMRMARELVEVSEV